MPRQLYFKSFEIERLRRSVGKVGTITYIYYTVYLKGCLNNFLR